MQILANCTRLYEDGIILQEEALIFILDFIDDEQRSYYQLGGCRKNKLVI